MEDAIAAGVPGKQIALMSMSKAVTRKKKNTPSLQRYSVEQVIDAIVESNGVIALAAEILGCERRAVYRYMDRYPVIKAAHKDARERTVDYAENEQLKALKRGERWAIENWLFHSKEGRERGWLKKAEAASDQNILNAIQIVMPDNDRGDAQPEVTVETIEADLRHVSMKQGLEPNNTSVDYNAEYQFLFAEELDD